ncbi:MAG: hypothetical protein HY290_10260 [Planctomycetia bacterium]|nr:hypothetical protein [Planctomycetia bacterium]
MPNHTLQQTAAAILVSQSSKTRRAVAAAGSLVVVIIVRWANRRDAPSFVQRPPDGSAPRPLTIHTVSQKAPGIFDRLSGQFPGLPRIFKIAMNPRLPPRLTAEVFELQSAGVPGGKHSH